MTVSIEQDALVIRVPSTSPQEDRMSFMLAITNSLKCQRDRELPIDIHEHNFWLLELLDALLKENAKFE